MSQNPEEIKCTGGPNHIFEKNPKSGYEECRLCGLKRSNVYDTTSEKRTFGEPGDAQRKRSDYQGDNNIDKVFTTPSTSKYKTEYLKSCGEIDTILTQKLGRPDLLPKHVKCNLLEYYKRVINARESSASEAKAARSAASSTAGAATKGRKRYRTDDDDDEDEDDDEKKVTAAAAAATAAAAAAAAEAKAEEEEQPRPPAAKKAKVTKIRGDTEWPFLVALIYLTLKSRGYSYVQRELCKACGVKESQVKGYVKRLQPLLDIKCGPSGKGNADVYCEKLHIYHQPLKMNINLFYDTLSPSLDGSKPQTVYGVAIYLYLTRAKFNKYKNTDMQTNTHAPLHYCVYLIIYSCFFSHSHTLSLC